MNGSLIVSEPICFNSLCLSLDLSLLENGAEGSKYSFLVFELFKFLCKYFYRE